MGNPTPEALAEAATILNDWQTALPTGFAMNRDDLEILYRSIAAALTRREPQWQPIETAPKDGTEILAAAQDPRVLETHWDRAVSEWVEEQPCGTITGWFWPYPTKGPTHWQPLPPPPQEKP